MLKVTQMVNGRKQIGTQTGQNPTSVFFFFFLTTSLHPRYLGNIVPLIVYFRNNFIFSEKLQW